MNESLRYFTTTKSKYTSPEHTDPPKILAWDQIKDNLISLVFAAEEPCCFLSGALDCLLNSIFFNIAIWFVVCVNVFFLTNM